ncbi:MAG: hypothetical protein PHI79_06025 [Sulfurovaceae bacterium]|nr:hypothetical protein [Sulfurovaceae bacterium]MDD5549136.1 hypothetical protein [Sulfurovaceae bacterium]
MKSYEELKQEFENLKIGEDFCISGECETNNDLKDYPSYTEALYKLLMAPSLNGVYVTRWDLKEIATLSGESIAISPRKRMFEQLMGYASDKENMQKVLEQFKLYFLEKIDAYEKLSSEFPASKPIFDAFSAKANYTVRNLPNIIKEYF